MKKTWIKIKRGLLEPKHRVCLGIRVWLYIYILDLVDWETGKVLEWKDKSAASELQIDLDTLRQQRKQLEDDGYISCKQRQHCLEISIHNWTNPREYTGQLYNPSDSRVWKSADPESEDVSQGLNQGSNQGLNQGTDKVKTLPINPHTTNHITHDRKYTKRKSYDEVVQEKAADYTRYRRSKFVHQGAE